MIDANGSWQDGNIWKNKCIEWIYLKCAFGYIEEEGEYILGSSSRRIRNRKSETLSKSTRKAIEPDGSSYA